MSKDISNAQAMNACNAILNFMDRFKDCKAALSQGMNMEAEIKSLTTQRDQIRQQMAKEKEDHQKQLDSMAAEAKAKANDIVSSATIQAQEIEADADVQVKAAQAEFTAVEAKKTKLLGDIKAQEESLAKARQMVAKELTTLKSKREQAISDTEQALKDLAEVQATYNALVAKIKG